MKIILNTLDFHMPSEINGCLTTGLWKHFYNTQLLVCTSHIHNYTKSFQLPPPPPPLKVARLDFLGGIPAKFERQLRRRE